MTDSIERIEDLEQLEEMLSQPTPEVVDVMRRLQGDILVLGVGGKIGPSLAAMTRRASEQAGNSRRVIGVARFSDSKLEDRLNSQGVETIRCDLLDRAALDRLPDAPNILYLPAMKFGSTGAEALTWAMNTYLPGMVCERFPASRIVSYSTGNVYPMTPADGPGANEETPLSTEGDYATSCIGRERILSYFSQKFDMPVAIARLNYANEMRYGVLVDLARQVLAGESIDLTMGHFNAIWQGDSNAMTLRCFDHAATPPFVVNLAGPENLSVRRVAEQFGRLMDRPVAFTGQEASDALLSDGRRGYERLGHPSVTSDQLIRWIADWTLRGGPTLGKPTHFQTRDGKF